MTDFTIILGNQTLQAEQTDDNNFIVHIADKPQHIYVKQDNEGANHWFDARANNETPQTIELGKAIEAYLVNV